MGIADHKTATRFMLPKGFVRADTDGQLYRREDTYWIFPPTDEDPGFIGPKTGARTYDELMDYDPVDSFL
jgi:hypothetical protein